MKTIVEFEHYRFEKDFDRYTKIDMCVQKVILNGVIPADDAKKIAKEVVKTPRGTYTNLTITYE